MPLSGRLALQKTTAATMPMINHPVAPLWRRFAALGYDLFLLLAITFAYGAVATFVDVQLGGATTADYEPMFEGPWFLIGWLILMLWFYIWFWHKSGQTLGMRTWRIQVVDKDSQTRLPGWSQCTGRALAGAVSFWCLGIGYWYAWFHPLRLCWHDQISRTQVIVLPKIAKNGQSPNRSRTKTR